MGDPQLSIIYMHLFLHIAHGHDTKNHIQGGFGHVESEFDVRFKIWNTTLLKIGGKI